MPPMEIPTHGCIQRPTHFLFQIWEESYQRVANEQEIYEGHRQLLLGAPLSWS